MKIDGIDIPETVASLRAQIESDTTITPALKVTIELLLLIVTLLCNRLGLNSKNSSKPPSSDPNRDKDKASANNKKPGGQKGRKGVTLTQFDNPDNIEPLYLDRASLPEGQYTDAGFEKRQVVDIEFKTVITEYQAQVLKNENGKKFVASFPQGITRPIQYGASVKAHAVYLSQYQLLPYERICEYFADQLSLPLSSGSLYNFINEGFELTKSTGALAHIKQQLKQVPVLHVDETGINVNGSKYWLHTASSVNWTYFYSHKKRGIDAMDEAGILPEYSGILCHDHWKPYFRYCCEHILCNAHHLRELTRAHEQDEQQWAEEMRLFLIDTNQAVDKAGGKLNYSQVKSSLKQYRKILGQADKECPEPVRKPGQKGRIKKGKSRNLLERLRDYEKEVLRFIVNPDVPFTNNQGENDIRMTKVHQKISGCFRSETGGKMFCAIRSYISSCRKQNISVSTALNLLFSGHLPDIFVTGAE